MSHIPPRYVSVEDEEFNFPRPEDDADIERMFDEVQLTRNLGNSKQLRNLPIDHKWLMVHNDELERWREEKKRLALAGAGSNTLAAKDSPEWYIKKFMDHTIQPKHLQSLKVSIRTLPVS